MTLTINPLGLCAQKEEVSMSSTIQSLPSFVHESIFDSNDIQNLLSPSIYFVGAAFGGSEDVLPEFLNKGIWVNGWALNPEDAKFQASVVHGRRTETIKKGDIILIKRLNGQGSSTMRVLAAGIVVGHLYPKQLGCQVFWSMPDIEITTNLKEVGTISTPLKISDLEDPIKVLVEKTRVRFLKMNLRIIPKC